MNPHSAIAADDYEIHFEPVSGHGPRLSFPCDRAGRVHLDGLSDRARNNYLFARAVVGRDYLQPAVLRRVSH